MTAAWAEGLKVAELKEELKKRGLLCTGVKAILCQRLIEALQSETNVEDTNAAAPSAEEDPDASAPPDVVPEKKPDSPAPKPDPPVQATETPASKPESVADAGGSANIVEDILDVVPEKKPDAPAPKPDPPAPEPPASKPESAADAEASSNILEDILGEDVDADRMESGESDEEPEEEPTPPSPAAAPPAKEAPKPKETPAIKDPSPPPKVDSTPRQPPPAASSEPKAVAGASNQQEPEPMETDTPGGRKRKAIPSFQPRDTTKDAKEQPAPSPRTSTPVVEKAAEPSKIESASKDEKPAKASSLPSPTEVSEPPAKIARTGSTDRPRVPPTPNTPAPGAKGGPTTALRINGLVRPFTENQLKELLSKTGKIVNIWLPTIKTHAIVTFATAEEAAATFEAVKQLKWPTASPKNLDPVYLSAEQAEYDIAVGRNPALAKSGAPSPASDSAGKRPLHNQRQPAGQDVMAAMAANALAKAAASVAAGRASVTRQPSAGADPVNPKPTDMAAAPNSADPDTSDPPAPVAPVVEEEGLELDALFKKTKTKPCIYFLPLTDADVERRKAREAKTVVNGDAKSRGPVSAPATSDGGRDSARMSPERGDRGRSPRGRSDDRRNSRDGGREADARRRSGDYVRDGRRGGR